MSDESRDRFEIPKEMRSMAEASFDQARKSFEKFLANAHQTAGTIEERGATVRAGAKEISAKAISYAERNVQTSLDYAQSLLKAKDLAEVMRLHSDFVQGQMRSLAEQASEMGQIVARRRWTPPARRPDPARVSPTGFRKLDPHVPSGAAPPGGEVMRHRNAIPVAMHKFDMLWV